MVLEDFCPFEHWKCHIEMNYLNSFRILDTLFKKIKVNFYNPKLKIKWFYPSQIKTIEFSLTSNNSRAVGVIWLAKNSRFFSLLNPRNLGVKSLSSAILICSNSLDICCWETLPFKNDRISWPQFFLNQYLFEFQFF